DSLGVVPRPMLGADIARDAPVVPPMRTLAAQYPRVRLPHDSDLPGAPGTCPGHRPDVPALAAGVSAGPDEASAPTRLHQSPATAPSTLRPTQGPHADERAYCVAVAGMSF